MVLFLPPFYFVFYISNLLSYIQNNFSYELARPIMGTIFLVIHYICSAWMPNFWTVSQRDNRICNRIHGNVTGRVSCNTFLELHHVSFSLSASTEMSTCSKEAFKDYLRASFPPDAKRSRSALVHKVFCDKIVSYLKGDEVSNGKSNEEKHFRHYVKKTGFKLLDFPAVGLRDALVVPVKEE